MAVWLCNQTPTGEELSCQELTSLTRYRLAAAQYTPDRDWRTTHTLQVLFETTKEDLVVWILHSHRYATSKMRWSRGLTSSSRWLLNTTAWLLAFSTLVASNEVALDAKRSQQCSGMFSRAAVGGNINPFIEVVFQKQEDQPTGNVSVVVFEYKNIDSIGVRVPIAGGEGQEVYLLCDEAALQADLCVIEERGQFLIDTTARNNTKLNILSRSVDLSNPLPIRYDIKHTSYFCVSTLSRDVQNYKGVVEFRNSYGELPAGEYFNLPFYGALAVVYVVVGFLWGFQYVQHKSEILPVQNYLTALLIFLSCEMIIVWGYYDYVNLHGFNIGSRVYMIITAVLNAFRNSFSFFMVLIVSLGHSVVRPSLGPAMLKARLLAVAHFAFGSLYGVTTMAVGTSEAPSYWMLLVVVPLAATLTTFYLWTLQALKSTIAELDERGQRQKSLMYRRLAAVLWWSIVALCVFVILQSVAYSNVNSPEFIPHHWKDRMVLNGWLNTLYLTVFCTIVFLWRPTQDNRRFAMSDEVRQEDYDMDVNVNYRGDEDDEEEQIGAPAYRAGSRGGQFGIGRADSDDESDAKQSGKPSGATVANPLGQGPSKLATRSATAAQGKKPNARDEADEDATLFDVGGEDDDEDPFVDPTEARVASKQATKS